MERPILLATRSEGKLRELRPLLENAGYRVMDLRDAGIGARDAESEIEAHESFQANAEAKAHYFFEAAGGSLPTIADDSGLEVQALGGAPGVRSKRWSGRADLSGQALDDANNEKLLAALGSHANRRARYVCAAAYVDAERAFTCEGYSGGRILAVARGAGGFGYDPYFESDELGHSFAEAEREEKERVSHRGRAFRAMLSVLRAAGA
ncbi:MAG: non-canonical purine NTP pyrophosphatase [Gemmatimonadota bacterium]|nr:non-canonical purine NTP pyrophosphatase [Gemmatimonadota bacterium]